MAVIDIGAVATDRGSDRDFLPRTLVNMENPANATGTIDEVEIWMQAEADDVEVATFYVTDTNDLSTRDSEALGTIVAGSKQTASGLDMDVTAGDYLGIGASSGSIEFDGSGGTGIWTISGDYIPCTSQTFFTGSGDTISLYGTGATPVVGIGAFYQRRNPFGLNIQTAGQVRAG